MRAEEDDAMQSTLTRTPSARLPGALTARAKGYGEREFSDMRLSSHDHHPLPDVLPRS